MTPYINGLYKSYQEAHQTTFYQNIYKFSKFVKEENLDGIYNVDGNVDYIKNYDGYYIIKSENNFKLVINEYIHIDVEILNPKATKPKVCKVTLSESPYSFDNGLELENKYEFQRTKINDLCLLPVFVSNIIVRKVKKYSQFKTWNGRNYLRDSNHEPVCKDMERIICDYMTVVVMVDNVKKGELNYYRYDNKDTKSVWKYFSLDYYDYAFHSELSFNENVYNISVPFTPKTDFIDFDDKEVDKVRHTIMTNIVKKFF